MVLEDQSHNAALRMRSNIMSGSGRAAAYITVIATAAAIITDAHCCVRVAMNEKVANGMFDADLFFSVFWGSLSICTCFCLAARIYLHICLFVSCAFLYLSIYLFISVSVALISQLLNQYPPFYLFICFFS